MSNLIKKITTKTVCGDIKKLAKPLKDGEGMDLVRVFGVARDIKTGESDYGPWTKFLGNFQAINIVSGEEFKSTACMLPDTASELLEAALQNEGVNEVNFAFDISIKGDSNSTIGYQYVCSPLLEDNDSDPLAKLASSLPKLPAPKKASK